MLTREQELTIREVLANKAGAIPELGYIRPSAQYFAGRADFWATVDQTKDTANEIEETLISATWIYPVSFVDDTTAASAHSPLINLTYEFYHFTQYAALRDDETDTPDVFSSKVLKQHADFISGWLALKEAFQGEITIAELDPAEFAKRQTLPLVQFEDLGTQSICEFIPGVVGYDYRLRGTVRVQSTEC